MRLVSAGFGFEGAAGSFKPIDDGFGHFVNLGGDLFEVARDGEFVAAMTLRGVIEEMRQFPVLQNYFGVADIFVEEGDDAERHEAVGQTTEFVESGRSVETRVVE